MHIACDHPMTRLTHTDCNAPLPLRNIYEPMFIRYGVSIVFNGHDHNYQRTYPMNNYKRDTCGPVHIVLGNGERAGWLAGHCQPFITQYLIRPCGDSGWSFFLWVECN